MNLINIENITKNYTDTPLFEEASFTVDEMEKVGIIGINGTGKTTLLKMLIGMETPDKGTVTRANNIVIRYLPQTPDFQKDMTVLEAVIEGNLTHDNEWSLESDAKTMLQKLGISDYGQKVDTMSGGQRKRIALAHTLLSRADVLVLDEPISHDRYFLDRVVRRIFAFEDGMIRQYEGGFTDYQVRRQEEGCLEISSDKTADKSMVQTVAKESGASLKSVKNRQDKLKFTYKEQKEYEAIEDEIAALEGKLEKIETDMAENASDFVKLNKLSQEREAAEQLLETKI